MKIPTEGENQKTVGDDEYWKLHGALYNLLSYGEHHHGEDRNYHLKLFMAAALLQLSQEIVEVKKIINNKKNL
jgi:hypothetical protein